MTAEIHATTAPVRASVTPWWAALWVLVGALALLLLARPAPAWDAAEVDGLAGGAQLADALTTGAGGLKERVLRGFAGVPGHPLCATAPERLMCREAATDSPLVRWVVAGAALTMPGADDAASASLGAALVLALAALVTGLVLARQVGRGGAALVLAVALLLALPGAMASASGAGVAALGALVSALVIAAMERVRRGGGGLVAGGAVGLALALHPAGVALVVPLFVVAAIGARPRDRGPADRGLVPLPPVAPSLFLAPAVALVVFAALWPAAWHGTTLHLGAWLEGGMASPAPPQLIAGAAFDQARGRAPTALVGLLQWVAWTPLPLLVLWLVGVAATARAGRAGMWSPLAVLATLLLVAGLDGGLFGARRNLLAWLWVPTALTASIGAVALGDWLARHRPRLSAGRALAVVTGLALVTPVASLVLGVEPSGAAHFGAQTRAPLPIALLGPAPEGGGATSVFVPDDSGAYAYAARVLSDRGPRALRWESAPEAADWLLVVQPGAEAAAPEGVLAERELWATGFAAGLRVDAYRRP
jgi:hypothetical protein